jgi:GR25 family glycosyltransferase involved in LPS biosynthesis
MKLDNFPPVYYITLEDSKLRQEVMENQLESFGVKDYTKFIAFDGRKIDFCETLDIRHRFDDFHGEFDSGVIATMLSHMYAIKYWLQTSDSPTAVFFEDDINLNTCHFWNFTWDDIMEKVNEKEPGWQVIQLSLIRTDDAEIALDEKDLRFRRRTWYNWSAGAYMMTRGYAERLVANHIPEENVLNTDLLDHSEVFPCIENMLYVGARPFEYTIPLFVENVNFKSTFYPKFIEQDRKNGQIHSSDFVYNWWKKNGPNLDFDWFMRFKNARYWETNED